MRFSSHRARLSDVAKLAGVSDQTVSRVVHGASVVAPETQERVLAAVEGLGYRPNLAARSLSNRHTDITHAASATSLFGGHARTFLSIVSGLGRLGYQTSMAGSPRGQDPTLDRLVSLGVDRTVVLGGHTQSADLASVVYGRISAMLIGQRLDLPDDVASVAINQGAAARKTIDHLLEPGRQRLLHICGPSDWFDAHECRDGFSAICRETGIKPVRVSFGSWEARSDYAFREHFPNDIDGLSASNDHLALGALHWLAEYDRAVPEDVAVVGVDDVDGVDSFLPPLTAIRQPHQGMGAYAVGHLAKLIVRGPAKHVVLASKLIIRESTKGH